MLTILVPTDFSAASRAGLRFAIQWARQTRARLIFVHVFNPGRLTRWSEAEYETFAASESALYQKRLERFVSETYHRMNVRPGHYTCLLLDGVGVEATLMDHCRKHPEVDYICMGTRGAGRLKKILGTHTGNLILHASVPVISVPSGYRARPVTSLLYATDLLRHKEEIEKIVALAKALKTSVEVLHLSSPGEPVPDTEHIGRVWTEQFGFDLKVDFRRLDITRSLAANLEEYIQRYRPSLLVLFTDRTRTPFEKVFFPSKAEALSFKIKVPLLAFGQVPVTVPTGS